MRGIDKKFELLNKKFNKIKKTVELAVVKAKNDKPLNFESKKLNFIRSFLKINKFDTKNKVFGGQQETKLKPY